MGVTSIYGLPYLEPSDPPDIAGITEALAQATEDELQRIDLAALGAMVGMEAASEVAPQSIPALTITGVRWQPASSNVGGFTKPSVFEFAVPTAGVYVATIQGTVTNGQTGRAYADVAMDNRRFRTPFGGAGESGFGATGTRRLAAGAIVKAELYCATATTLGASTLVIYRLGA